MSFLSSKFPIHSLLQQIGVDPQNGRISLRDLVGKSGLIDKLAKSMKVSSTTIRHLLTHSLTPNNISSGDLDKISSYLKGAVNKPSTTVHKQQQLMGLMQHVQDVDHKLGSDHQAKLRDSFSRPLGRGPTQAGFDGEPSPSARRAAAAQPPPPRAAASASRAASRPPATARQDAAAPLGRSRSRSPITEVVALRIKQNISSIESSINQAQQARARGLTSHRSQASKESQVRALIGHRKIAQEKFARLEQNYGHIEGMKGRIDDLRAQLKRL